MFLTFLSNLGNFHVNILSQSLKKYHFIILAQWGHIYSESAVWVFLVMEFMDNKCFNHVNVQYSSSDYLLG